MDLLIWCLWVCLLGACGFAYLVLVGLLIRCLRVCLFGACGFAY